MLKTFGHLHYFILIAYVRDVCVEHVYLKLFNAFQNDPGVSGQFSTYIKARILCERDIPPGRQFVGTTNYQYNEISKYTCIVILEIKL